MAVLPTLHWAGAREHRQPCLPHSLGTSESGFIWPVAFEWFWLAGTQGLGPAGELPQPPGRPGGGRPGSPGIGWQALPPTPPQLPATHFLNGPPGWDVSCCSQARIGGTLPASLGAAPRVWAGIQGLGHSQAAQLASTAERGWAPGSACWASGCLQAVVLPCWVCRLVWGGQANWGHCDLKGSSPLAFHFFLLHRLSHRLIRH